MHMLACLAISAIISEDLYLTPELHMATQQLCCQYETATILSICKSINTQIYTILRERNEDTLIVHAYLIHSVGPSTMSVLQRLDNFQVKVDIHLISNLNATRSNTRPRSLLTLIGHRQKND